MPKTPQENDRQPEVASPKTGRDEWAVLSGLRFLLATIVLLAHCRFLTPDAPFFIKYCVLLGGMPSVYGFFLVSGYSIAASINLDCRGFYQRRVARIYPVYLICFALGLLAYAQVGGTFKVLPWDTPKPNIPLWALSLNAIGLPFLLAIAPRTFEQSWSLTCEIVYYAFAPYLRRWSDRALISAALISFAYYVYHHNNNWSSVIYGKAIAGLAWFWLAGFILYRHRTDRLIRPVFVGLIIGGCSLTWSANESYTCINLLISLLVIVYSTEIELPAHARRFLTYLGNISYPLYLVHLPIYAILSGYLTGLAKPNIAICAMYPICATISAIVIYHLVDVPGRKLVLKVFGFKRPNLTIHESADRKVVHGRA